MGLLTGFECDMKAGLTGFAMMAIPVVETVCPDKADYTNTERLKWRAAIRVRNLDSRCVNEQPRLVIDESGELSESNHAMFQVVRYRFDAEN